MMMSDYVTHATTGHSQNTICNSSVVGRSCDDGRLSEWRVLSLLLLIKRIY